MQLRETPSPCDQLSCTNSEPISSALSTTRRTAQRYFRRGHSTWIPQVRELRLYNTQFRTLSMHGLQSISTNAILCSSYHENFHCCPTPCSQLSVSDTNHVPVQDVFRLCSCSKHSIDELLVCASVNKAGVSFALNLSVDPRSDNPRGCGMVTSYGLILCVVAYGAGGSRCPWARQCRSLES